MSHVSKNTLTAPPKYSSNIEKCLDGCKEKFNQILSGVLNGGKQDAHKMEASIFNQLIKLGFLLMQLYFASQNKGNYGKTIETAQGIAKRGRTSEKSYFSIFGKMKVTRYFYHIGDVSFAPLDIVLNLPVRCYSYFLSEFANLLNINGAYENASGFLRVNRNWCGKLSFFCQLFVVLQVVMTILTIDIFLPFIPLLNR